MLWYVLLRCESPASGDGLTTLDSYGNRNTLKNIIISKDPYSRGMLQRKLDEQPLMMNPIALTDMMIVEDVRISHVFTQ